MEVFWVVCYTQWIKSSAVIWYTAVSHRDTLMYTLCILNNGLHHMHITGTLKLNYSHFSYTRTMYIRKINVNSASVGLFFYTSKLTGSTCQGWLFTLAMWWVSVYELFISPLRSLSHISFFFNKLLSKNFKTHKGPILFHFL